ncbi:hypothetical protein IJI17_00985 [Candidatus Saccharibacteria bacterium]|nr:hypothetical protein [Candidatus Saccharibacteria bacterium]
MVNSKKLIAGLGVVAGLGVAMLPLTSYAVDPSDATTGNVVRVNVADTISVSVTEAYASGNAIAVNQNDENTSGLTHTVTVAGNTYNDYTLSVYAKDGETALKHTNVAGATIPTLTAAASSLTAGSWGYQYATAAGGSTYNGTWQPVQASANEAARIHTASGTKDSAYSEDWSVKYGVKTAETQLAGTYEATVIYTATASAAI